MVNIDELRATFLFETLTDDQLHWLAERAEETAVAAGARIVTEGEPADALWVLLEGELQVSRRVGGRELVTAGGTAPGTWAGWLPMTDGPSQITATILRPSRLLRIPPEPVRGMLVGGFPITDHLLAGIIYGVQYFEATARQQEQLASLGKLAAGLAHELNNPAAAARRAAERLHAMLHVRDEHAFALARRLDAAQADCLTALAAEAHDRPPPSDLDPLQRSDREDELAGWLDARGVEEAYELAPPLVEAGLAVGDLERIAARVPTAALAPALNWLGTAIAADTLADEVTQSVSRISDLVQAIKDYSFLDRAATQEVDVHAGLETTLKILAHKLRGVTVDRNYDPKLPAIWADGGELNQVWTNLLVNAIDAVRSTSLPEPRIAITTERAGEGVAVAIVDNGPGIPPAIRDRIFDPFMTTKGVGEGTGLGLDITHRIVVRHHQGEIRVDSRPGETRFRVWLPLGGVREAAHDDPSGPVDRGHDA